MSRQMLYGCDFGFIDPCTLSQSFIRDNELYICREFYETGLDPDMIKDRYSNLNWIINRNVIADSARPELIRMLNNTGKFQFSGARKNVGNKQKEGEFKRTMALYLRQFKKIHIHATNCPNAAKEFPLWSWEVDKNEKILETVKDGDDHTIDAVIYSLEREAKSWYYNNFSGNKNS